MTVPDSTIGDKGASRPRLGAAAVWLGLFALLGVVGFTLIRRQQGPVAVGSRAPDFELTTFSGETIRTADHRAQGHILVINFWASWCKPCEQEAEALEAAHLQLQDEGVFFMGVDWVDTDREARAYLERFDVSYPNGPDLGTRVSQSFRIRGVPETYVVAPDGRLTFVKIGPFESLDEILDAVATARGPASP